MLQSMGLQRVRHDCVTELKVLVFVRFIETGNIVKVIRGSRERDWGVNV